MKVILENLYSYGGMSSEIYESDKGVLKNVVSVEFGDQANCMTKTIKGLTILIFMFFHGCGLFVSPVTDISEIAYRGQTGNGLTTFMIVIGILSTIFSIVGFWFKSKLK